MYSSRTKCTAIAAAFATCVALSTNETEAAAQAQPTAHVFPDAQVVQQVESYCATSWRNARIPRADWSDCTQQVLTDLLERISRQRWSTALLDRESAERRQLNRAVWRTAKRWSRAARHASLCGMEPVDPRTISRAASELDDERLVLVQRAVERLTPRQRRILCWTFEGDAVNAISRRLGIPPARVSDEKYRAIQKVRQAVVRDTIS